MIEQHHVQQQRGQIKQAKPRLVPSSPAQNQRREQHESSCQLKWPVGPVRSRHALPQRHGGEPPLGGVDRFDRAPRAILRHERRGRSDEERQELKRHARGRRRQSRPKSSAPRDGEAEGGQGKDLHARTERDQCAAPPGLAALEGDERQDDEAGDERVALCVLHRAQRLEQEKGEGDHRGPRGEHPLHRDEQHEHAQRIPQEERERPGEPGEGREQHGERRTVLELVLQVVGVKRVHVLTTFQMARRGTENLEVAARAPRLAHPHGESGLRHARDNPVHLRARREPLARRVTQRGGQVERKQDATPTRRRHGGQASGRALDYRAWRGDLHGRRGGGGGLRTVATTLRRAKRQTL